jgi:hypothetical protein
MWSFNTGKIYMEYTTDVIEKGGLSTHVYTIVTTRPFSLPCK